MKQSLSQEKNAQIYCVKHGHANYIWNFFGYVHCGRCSTQIGDRLGGYFDTTDMILIGHKCKKCDNLKKKSSLLDKTIIKRLEKSKNTLFDYEKILKGLDFEEKK